MERHRIDHWLKLVCLFKQRSDATEACRGGHVRLNGQRVKPGAAIREGDVVEITEGRYRKVVVLELPQHSVSKEVARTMYRDETPETPKGEQTPIRRDRGSGRPTKKERREMDKWR
ncbi:MAG TPA: S4 domain-containing protein [Thermoanaerobaculia bacterium]|nr:S4 domain-containing protein [Thermoanaerobaculia bacterium]